MVKIPQSLSGKVVKGSIMTPLLRCRDSLTDLNARVRDFFISGDESQQKKALAHIESDCTKTIEAFLKLRLIAGVDNSRGTNALEKGKAKPKRRGRW